MSEFSRIRDYFLPLTNGNDMARGLIDDAALMNIPGGHSLIITSDAISEGVHFLPDTDPSLIAQKALRTNLSDLAAMGAAPHACMLSLLTPKTCDDEWIASFCGGLKKDQETYNITLIGGDSSSIHGPITLSITAFGLVETGKELPRSGAHIGDDIWVSGTIGDGFLGLHALQKKGTNASRLIGRYHLPEPRLELGIALRDIATSCMDVSDGLIQDMNHICRVSSCGASLKLNEIPISEQAQHYIQQHNIALTNLVTGGDDYELLFTAHTGESEKISELSAALSLPLTRIGRITKGKDTMLLDENNQKVILDYIGYQHS